MRYLYFGDLMLTIGCHHEAMALKEIHHTNSTVRRHHQKIILEERRVVAYKNKDEIKC